MSALKKILVVTTLLLVAIVVTTIVTISQMDLNTIKREAAWQLSQTLGLQVTISGRPRLVILPYLGLQTGRVAVRLPGDDTPLVSVENMIVKVAPAALLAGKIVILKANFDGVAVNLERSAAGQANWETVMQVLQQHSTGEQPTKTATASSESEDKTSNVSFEIRNFAVTNARIVFQDHAAEIGLEVRLIKFESDGVRENSPITFRTDFEIASRKPDILSSITAQGQIRLDTHSSNFVVTGFTTHIRTTGGAIPAGHGTVQLTSLLSYDHAAGVMDLQELVLHTDLASVQGELTVRGLRGEPELHGTLRASTSDIAAAVTDGPGRSSGKTSASVSARISAFSTSLLISDLAVRLGKDNFSGGLEADWSQAPNLRFKILGKRLDTRFLSNTAPGHTKQPSAAKASGSGVSAPDPIAQVRNLLKQARIDGSIQVGEVLMPMGKIDDLSIELQASNGQADGNISVSSFLDGTARVDVGIRTGANDIMDLVLGARLRRVDVSNLGFDLPKIEGKLDFDLNLSANGRLLSEVLSSLRAQASARLRDNNAITELRLIDGVPPLKPRGVDVGIDVRPANNPTAKSMSIVALSGRFFDADGTRAAALRLTGAIDAAKAMIDMPSHGAVRLQLLALNGKDAQGRHALEVDASARLDRQRAHLEIDSAKIHINGQPIFINGSVSDPLSDQRRIQATVSTRNADLNNMARFFGDVIPAGSLPENLPKLSLSLPLQVDQYAVRAKAFKVRLDDTNISGDAGMTLSDPPAIDFRLRAGIVDLNHYLDLAGIKAETQKADPKPATVSELEVDPRIDLSPLKKFRLKGKLQVERIMWNGQNFDDLAIQVRSDGSNFSVDPIYAKMFGGTFKGSFESKLKTHKPEMVMTVSIKDWHVGRVKRLTSDDPHKITGRADLSLHVNSAGVLLSDLKRNLSGRLGIKLKDVLIIRINDDGEETDPIPITGGVVRFEIDDGKLSTNNIVLASPDITARGRGNIDIVDNTINMTIDVSYKGLVGVPVTIEGKLLDPNVGAGIANAIIGSISANLYNGVFGFFDPLIHELLQ